MAAANPIDAFIQNSQNTHNQYVSTSVGAFLDRLKKEYLDCDDIKLTDIETKEILDEYINIFLTYITSHPKFSKDPELISAINLAKIKMNEAIVPSWDTVDFFQNGVTYKTLISLHMTFGLVSAAIFDNSAYPNDTTENLENRVAVLCDTLKRLQKQDQKSMACHTAYRHEIAGCLNGVYRDEHFVEEIDSFFQDTPLVSLTKTLKTLSAEEQFKLFKIWIDPNLPNDELVKFCAKQAEAIKTELRNQCEHVHYFNPDDPHITERISAIVERLDELPPPCDVHPYAPMIKAIFATKINYKKEKPKYLVTIKDAAFAKAKEIIKNCTTFDAIDKNLFKLLEIDGLYKEILENEGLFLCSTPDNIAKFKAFKNKVEMYFLKVTASKDITDEDIKNLDDYKIEYKKTLKILKSDAVECITNFFQFITTDHPRRNEIIAKFSDINFRNEIILTDDQLTILQENYSANGEINLSSYEINRVLLTAALTSPKNWSKLFYGFFTTVMSYIKNNSEGSASDKALHEAYKQYVTQFEFDDYLYKITHDIPVDNTQKIFSTPDPDNQFKIYLPQNLDEIEPTINTDDELKFAITILNEPNLTKKLFKPFGDGFALYFSPMKLDNYFKQNDPIQNKEFVQQLGLKRIRFLFSTISDDVVEKIFNFLCDHANINGFRSAVKIYSNTLKIQLTLLKIISKYHEKIIATQNAINADLSAGTKKVADHEITALDSTTVDFFKTLLPKAENFVYELYASGYLVANHPNFGETNDSIIQCLIENKNFEKIITHFDEIIPTIKFLLTNAKIDYNQLKIIMLAFFENPDEIKNFIASINSLVNLGITRNYLIILLTTVIFKDPIKIQQILDNAYQLKICMPGVDPNDLALFIANAYEKSKNPSATINLIQLLIKAKVPVEILTHSIDSLTKVNTTPENISEIINAIKVLNEANLLTDVTLSKICDHASYAEGYAHILKLHHKVLIADRLSGHSSSILENKILKAFAVSEIYTSKNLKVLCDYSSYCLDNAVVLTLPFRNGTFIVFDPKEKVLAKNLADIKFLNGILAKIKLLTDENLAFFYDPKNFKNPEYVIKDLELLYDANILTPENKDDIINAGRKQSYLIARNYVALNEAGILEKVRDILQTGDFIHADEKAYALLRLNTAGILDQCKDEIKNLENTKHLFLDNLTSSFIKLHEENILTSENIKNLSTNPDNCLKLATALVNLRKEEILTPENISSLLENPKNAIDEAENIIEDYRGRHSYPHP